MSASRPYAVGLTGGIGSGKSTAAAILEELGAVRIDADAISRSLTAPGGEALKAVREAFGPGFFGEDGSLDRGRMARAIFGDAEARAALEGIVHPMVRARMLDEAREAALRGARVVLYDVPLLFEAGMQDMCDEVWAVTCPAEERARRAAARDGTSREDVMARIACQMGDDERERRADRVLRNDGSLADLRARTEELYRDLLRRISGKGNA